VKNDETEGDMAIKLKQFYRDLTEGRVERPPRVYAGKEIRPAEKMKYEATSARAVITAVVQFFHGQGVKKWDVEFELKGAEASPRPSHHKFVFTREHLQKILALVSVRDKALICLGASSGWASGDILALKREEVENTIASPEHIFEKNRGKESALMFLCLTEETCRYLNLYLKTSKTKEFLFEGYGEKPLGGDEPDRILKQACDKLGIKGKSKEEVIRFHALRSYFDRTASKAGMAYASIEECMGHRLPMGGAYKELPQEDVWSEFKKAEPALTIEANIAVNGLEKVIGGMREEMARIEAERVEEMAELKEYAKVCRDQSAQIADLLQKISELEAKIPKA
jgi:integrase